MAALGAESKTYTEAFWLARRHFLRAKFYRGTEQFDIKKKIIVLNNESIKGFKDNLNPLLLNVQYFSLKSLSNARDFTRQRVNARRSFQQVSIVILSSSTSL